MKKLINLFLIIVPLLLSITYIFFIAEDRYVSSSKFTVKSEGESAGASMALGLLGGTSNATQDQLIIRDRILSFDMTKKVVDKFGVEGYISSIDGDFIWNITNLDDTLKIHSQLSKLINITFDEEAAVTTIDVETFDPLKSKELNDFLLEEAISFMNNFSTGMSENYIRFAEKEARDAQKSLTSALDNLQRFQEDNGVISPEREGTLITSSLSDLEAKLAGEKINLSSLKTYLQDDSSKVQQSLAKIASYEALIAQQKEKISDDENLDITELNRKYIELEGEVEFAKKAYETSLIALESARMKAIQSQKHLMVVEEPNIPNKAEQPNKVKLLISSLLAIAIFNIIMRLSLTMIREYN